MTHSAKKKVAIIGAGWAGCAAAVELSRQGQDVTIFESAGVLGGRARCVNINGLALDNGQHILLGAYSETLRLMRIVDIDLAESLLNLPLQMRYPRDSGGMDFVAPRLPAPLHLLVALLRAEGLSFDDKLALARFSTTARWMGWQLNTDCSVTELLTRFDQTDRLTQLMWRPLCIAALNTPPDRASAQVFLNVLRDSLGARRAASDMLIPRVNLTTLFPQYAASFVERQGSKVLVGHTVNRIMKQDAGWQLNVSGSKASEQDKNYFDAVVVATQAMRAATLLKDWIDVSPLAALAYEPITTCYLQYGPSIRLPQAFYALIDDGALGHWGQFVFDRGALDSNHAGLLAVVVSASTEAIALSREALTAAIAAQLSDVLQWPELMQPKWGKVITEKRATFACSPGLIRPSNLTTHNGLMLAGDYTASAYPATLESAVRSGVSAAQSILDNAI